MSTEKQGLEGLRIDRTVAPARASKVWLLVFVLVLMVVAGGVLFWLQRPQPVAVRTEMVRVTTTGGDRTLLNASGYVTARRQATISSKVTGKVTEVLVEEGMKVEADQVLARLDSSNVEAGLKQAQAQMESMQKSLEETTPALDRAERELQRFTQLAGNEYVSKSELDRVDTDARSLRARQARQVAEVAATDRSLSVWKQQLEDTVIRAPFGGVVISKDAQPGEMVSPVSAGGGFTRTGICTIVDMSSLEVDVDVNESYINRVTPGQPATATLDAYPDWRIPAKVIAIIPTADRQKATVKVRVGFEKLDPRILPDMSAKVAFQEAGEAPKVAPEVLVPKAAVHDQGGQSIVWLAHDGRAERRAISVGLPRGDDVAVIAGLSGGEKIILDGADHLTDGAAIAEAKP